MRYLLDTHAWIWAFQGSSSLSPRIRKLIQGLTMADLALADISLLEAARKIATGEIKITAASLPAEWLEQAAGHVHVLPITAAIAWRSAALAWTHKDPADRLIVATAQEHHLTLITADKAMAAWGGVPILW